MAWVSLWPNAIATKQHSFAGMSREFSKGVADIARVQRCLEDVRLGP